MWRWVLWLLSFLKSWKTLFFWLPGTIDFCSHAFGWVSRLWNGIRNTLIGRLLRMAGFLCVAGSTCVALGRAIFSILAVLIDYPINWSWSFHPFIHSILGAVDCVIPLYLILYLLCLWVYVSLFLLSVRLAKYILSLTVG